VAVYDLLQQRVLRYAPDGSPSSTSRAPLPSGFLEASIGPRGIFSLATTPEAVERPGDSTIVGLYRLEENGEKPVKLFDLPIRAPGYALTDMRPLPQHFASRAVWLFGPDGDLLHTSGDRWEIDRFGATGVHLERLTVQVAPRAVEASEAARQEALRSSSHLPMPETGHASHHPAITSMVLLDTGELWVRESPDLEGAMVSWVIIAADGQLAARAMLSADAEVLAGRDSTLLVNAPSMGGLMLARVVR
jgi:hypothetical protein